MYRGVRVRRGLTAAALLAALSLFASGCGAVTSTGNAGGSGGGGSSKKIGVSVADQKSLFYIAAVDGMQAAAKKAGYELAITVADNNSSKQIQQINTLLTQQVGALIYIPQNSTAAAAGVTAANQAGVPVVAVDQRPVGGDLATYIATNSVKAAKKVCSWMFEQIDGKGNIGILHGVQGSTAEKQRTKGCQQALKDYPKVEVVANQVANWDENQAFTKTTNILTAHPDLKAIFGESDAMALGAAKAARQAGRNGMTFVGFDGFPTMLQAIESGLTDATMVQRPYIMGQIAVRNAIKFMKGNGTGIPKVQYQEAVLATSENVDEIDLKRFYGPKVVSAN